MINVKRLVTVFLILASVATISALSLTRSWFSSTGSKNVTFVTAHLALAGQNAFPAGDINEVPTLRKNLSGAPTNITEAAANNLAEVLLALNPEGPGTFDGTTGLVLPNNDILVAYLTKQSPQFSLGDLWSNIGDSDIITLNTSDPEAGRRYAESFQNIMRATISSPTFLKSLSDANQSPGGNLLGNAILTFDNAADQLQKLPVPAPAASFHKNFVTYLRDQVSVMKVVTARNVDPLKTLVVMNSSDKIERHISQDFLAAAQAYLSPDAQKLFAQSKQNGSLLSEAGSLLENLFGVHRAMALFGNIGSIGSAIGGAVGGSGSVSPLCNPEQLQKSKEFFKSFGGLAGSDLFGGIPGLSSLGIPSIPGIPGIGGTVPVQDDAVLKQTAAILTLLIFDCNRMVATEIAKNAGIHAMDLVILEKIQNESDPRFITNYNDYFTNAALQGATRAYKNISSDVCPEFLPEINRVVFDPNSVGGANVNGSVATVDVKPTTTITTAAGTSSGFGSGNVNGTGQGCPIKNQLDPVAFFDDFQNGGWDGFLALLNPANNSYGTLIAAHDAINGAAQQEATAAQARSIANQGYKSDVNCLEYYEDEEGNQICTKEQIKTPGIVTGDRLQEQVASDLNQLTDLQDLVELESAIADGLGIELINNPDQGLLNLSYSTGNSLSNLCVKLPPGPAASFCSRIASQIISTINAFNSISSILSNFNLGSIGNIISGSGTLSNVGINNLTSLFNGTSGLTTLGTTNLNSLFNSAGLSSAGINYLTSLINTTQGLSAVVAALNNIQNSASLSSVITSLNNGVTP